MREPGTPLKTSIMASATPDGLCGSRDLLKQDLDRACGYPPFLRALNCPVVKPRIRM